MSETARAGWRIRKVKPLLPWVSKTLRPADVSAGLRAAMLDRENMLEDVRYAKIVPNHYVVELGTHNFARNFQPIEEQITRQWRQNLLEHLTNTNQRQGRREYRFGGRVIVEIHSAPDLGDDQARILSRIAYDLEAGPKEPAPAGACLERHSDGKRFPLHPGTVTLGREASNEIYLDEPEVQQQRLVSSQHAYVRYEAGRFRLFDGSPGGKPSLNGTYLNLIRVGPEGATLHAGDVILLAAVNPNQPDPNAPGVAVFRFIETCP